MKLRLGINFVYNSKNTIKPKETFEETLNIIKNKLKKYSPYKPEYIIY